MESDSLRTDYTAIYQAWCCFRKGKRPSHAIDEFAYNLEINVAKLASELTDRSYQHRGYQEITLCEKKRRDLAVASIRDRVVHRLLYDYLVDQFDKTFDPDVWSCRVGKGLHHCLTRTQKLLRKYEYSCVWRADITKFFDSVDHGRLMECLRRKIGQDQTALRLCQEVIASYNVLNKQALRQAQGKQGIPIGNLTSQIFANIYLNEFDRFVRHRLKPQAYVRYGDDFILICPTRRAAFALRGQAEDFLHQHLRLSINPKSNVVVPAASGLKFLGHDITRAAVIVDRHTTKRILPKIGWHNVSSYKALALPTEAKNSLDWILLEKYVDMSDKT